MRYTYSRWDNTESAPPFDPDEVMEALADDLLADSGVSTSLQRVMRRGLHQDGEQRVPGLQWLAERLRSQRQQELEKYSLDGMMQNIKRQVADIVRAERGGIGRREEQANHQSPDLQEMVRAIVRRKKQFLDDLPPEPGPALSSLAEYEFLDERARAQFDALLETLQQQVLRAHFDTMQQSLRSLQGSELSDVKRMLRDMSDLLEDSLAGENVDFARFRSDHGRFFPDAETLEALTSQLRDQSTVMESLVQSMSPEMRYELDTLMKSVLQDRDVHENMGRVAMALEALCPLRPSPSDYPFSGTTSLTLDEAMRLLKRLQDLDRLEHDIKRCQELANVDELNSDRVRALMGDDAARAVEHLQHLTDVLQEAGYIQNTGVSFEVTARGLRKIGQKALKDIFRNLKRDSFGSHVAQWYGAGGDRIDDSKPYEFGDAFFLDLNATLMNAVLRQGSGCPIRLSVRDFEVHRTESMTRTSTVLLLDMSRSMPLRGCFIAAKKVAFALNSLIRTQYPRDSLYVVGFSDYARLLPPETLHQITWGDYVYGTNMQHGFILARRLLGQHKSSNKQIILITDGEPTAHFDGDRVQFSYPPTFQTFQETLREVRRCTQDHIVINTFMLERSHYLAEFVNQMARINRGRTFFSTPERLGDYILVDYVAGKRKSAATRAFST